MNLSLIQRAALRSFNALALPPGSKVLDAPCGDGSLAAALRQAGHDAHGVDMNGTGAGLLGPAYTDADLNGRLPCADASFDVVLSIEGIEHLEGRYRYLRELHRVLKPGGTLILTTPNIVSVRSRVRFFGSGFYHRDGRPLREAERNPFHHIALSTLADLRYALHTSGFRLTGVGHTHIKTVSFLYGWLVPWMWLYTAMAFRKEKDDGQRRANLEIRAALFSRSVLFGENLLLTAIKLQSAQAGSTFRGGADVENFPISGCPGVRDGRAGRDVCPDERAGAGATDPGLRGARSAPG